MAYRSGGTKRRDQEQHRLTPERQTQTSGWLHPQNSIPQNAPCPNDRPAVWTPLPELPDLDRRRSQWHPLPATPARGRRLQPSRPERSCPPPVEAPKRSHAKEPAREKNFRCSLIRLACTFRL